MRLSAITAVMVCVTVLPANAARAAGRDGARAVLCPQVVRPVIDGTLDDACWQAIGPPGEFDDASTHRTADPRTSMSIGHDDRAIYVALWCAEPRMQSLRPAVTAVDGDVFNEDCAVVLFDTGRKRAPSFIEFAANLLATKHDAFDDDHAWNGDWQVAVQRGTDEWTMEIAIPFTDLRVHPDSGDLWGFNAARYRQAAGGEQLFTWSPVTDGFWRTETFGYLIFDSLDLNLERQFTQVELRLKAEQGDVARLSRTLGRDSRHVREMVTARSAVMGVGRRIKAGVANAGQWTELRAELAAAEAAYDDALWNLRFEELFAE
jgi:hypothetical protein